MSSCLLLTGQMDSTHTQLNTWFWHSQRDLWTLMSNELFATNTDTLSCDSNRRPHDHDLQHNMHWTGELIIALVMNDPFLCMSSGINQWLSFLCLTFDLTDTIHTWILNWFLSRVAFMHVWLKPPSSTIAIDSKYHKNYSKKITLSMTVKGHWCLLCVPFDRRLFKKKSRLKSFCKSCVTTLELRLAMTIGIWRAVLQFQVFSWSLHDSHEHLRNMQKQSNERVRKVLFLSPPKE